MLPILVGHSPAGAAFFEDSDEEAVRFRPTVGERVNCDLKAVHAVDTDSGELTITLFSGASDTDPCRGRLAFIATYVDPNGEAMRTDAVARGTHNLTVVEHNAGSAAVTVSYSVQFTDCVSNCEHVLQTRTK